MVYKAEEEEDDDDLIRWWHERIRVHTNIQVAYDSTHLCQLWGLTRCYTLHEIKTVTVSSCGVLLSVNLMSHAVT